MDINKEDLLQQVVDLIYQSYNQEKWIDMENGEKFMDELNGLMEKVAKLEESA